MMTDYSINSDLSLKYKDKQCKAHYFVVYLYRENTFIPGEQ